RGRRDRTPISGSRLVGHPRQLDHFERAAQWPPTGHSPGHRPTLLIGGIMTDAERQRRQDIVQGIAHLVRQERERQLTAGQLEEAPLAPLNGGEHWSDDDAYAQVEDTTYDGRAHDDEDATGPWARRIDL